MTITMPDVDQLNQFAQLLKEDTAEPKTRPQSVDVTLFFERDLHPTEVYVTLSARFTNPADGKERTEHPLTKYPIHPQHVAGYDETVVKTISAVLLPNYHCRQVLRLIPILHSEAKQFKGRAAHSPTLNGLHLSFERLGT